MPQLHGDSVKDHTLSMDALEVNLEGVDAYVLTLDARTINERCAVGKGAFGTEETVPKIRGTGPADLADHRRPVLPQLSAPGVTAHKAKMQTGLLMEHGPVSVRNTWDACVSVMQPRR